MFQIGLAGAWHVHFDQYAAAVQNRKDCQITALWDSGEKRGRAAAERVGCDFVPDQTAFFARDDVQGIIVCSETSAHPELLCKAAEAKKHIFTEKVLCFSTKQAMQIRQAVANSGVRFCISFPWRCKSALLFAKQAVDTGILGQVTYARVRNAHNGASAGWLPDHFYDPATCGGGAMMDLGAHPMYLLQWLLGQPVSVSSVFGKVTGKPVEDNAVSVLAFKNGAIAVSETAFVAQNDPFSLEISGTKGSLFAGGPADALQVNTGDGWQTPALPASLPEPIDMWVDGCINGGEIAFGIDDAVALTRLMEAAYRSYETGKVAVL